MFNKKLKERIKQLEKEVEEKQQFIIHINDKYEQQRRKANRNKVVAIAIFSDYCKRGVLKDTIEEYGVLDEL